MYSLAKSDATLITFFLQTTEYVHSVELLGSWDSFDKPYHLSRDRRVGENNWRGCHLFDNITHDGDDNEAEIRRAGTLKMGGTYWYYYRLNGETTQRNPVEPISTTCPILPGQAFNVLELPIQDSACDSSTTSLDSLVFTLDPKDKYTPLGVRRAATVSALEARKIAATPPPKEVTTMLIDIDTSEHNLEDVSPQRPRSLHTLFSKLRRSKSSHTSPDTSPVERASTSWSRRLLSRAGSIRAVSRHERPTQISVPDVPLIPQDLVVGMSRQASDAIELQKPGRSTDHTSNGSKSRSDASPLISEQATLIPQISLKRQDSDLDFARPDIPRLPSLVPSTLSYSSTTTGPSTDTTSICTNATPSDHLSPVHPAEPDTPEFSQHQFSSLDQTSPWPTTFPYPDTDTFTEPLILPAAEVKCLHDLDFDFALNLVSPSTPKRPSPPTRAPPLPPSANSQPSLDRFLPHMSAAYSLRSDQKARCPDSLCLTDAHASPSQWDFDLSPRTVFSEGMQLLQDQEQIHLHGIHVS